MKGYLVSIEEGILTSRDGYPAIASFSYMPLGGNTTSQCLGRSDEDLRIYFWTNEAELKDLVNLLLKEANKIDGVEVKRAGKEALPEDLVERISRFFDSIKEVVKLG